MGTRERKARERLNRENIILDAAEQVFFSQGFEQSTMDDVAKTAELSKGSLYNYFENKNELCLGIIGRSLQRLLEYIEKAVTGEKNGLKRIYAFGKAFMLFRKENPEYYCALQNLRGHSCGCKKESKFLNLTLTGNSRINTVLEDIILRGINDGTIRKNVNPALTAAAVWGEFSGILPGFDFNRNSADAFECVLELIINGLKK
ncbi:MAG: TetR/AcrR family transcriptional regulator [Victivallaceae bacterium]|nr:TetR/AcrR family transcriptional regulator [Victivallaceae bacterium]